MTSPADGHERTLRVEQEHREVGELWSARERTPHGDDDRAALLERRSVVLRSGGRSAGAPAAVPRRPGPGHPRRLDRPPARRADER